MQNNYVNRKNQDLEYAGFWVRLAAYCIDSAIVWVGLLFVNLAMGIFSMFGGSVLQIHLLFQYTLRDIILYVFQVIYFILLTYGTGTTLGKRLLNLRVVNADGSQNLSLINVVYRETVGRFLCGLSIGIGYIMAGVDRKKRGLHDMLCDTTVIYAKKIKVIPKFQVPQYYPPIPEPGPGPIPMPPYGNPPQGKPPAPGTGYGEPFQKKPPEQSLEVMMPGPGQPWRDDAASSSQRNMGAFQENNSVLPAAFGQKTEQPDTLDQKTGQINVSDQKAAWRQKEQNVVDE